MSAPTTDRGAIQQVIRALVAAGHTLLTVDNGEEVAKVSNETEAIAAITEVDVATLWVSIPESEYQGMILFVLGNDPEEVAADYSESLSPVLDPLTESWWS